MRFAFFCFIFATRLLNASPEDQVRFIDLKPFHHRTNERWGPVLTDVMNHEAPGDSNHYENQITLAHETTHGINAYIRNNLSHGETRVNGFYVTESRALILKEPNIRKSQVADYIPGSLQGNRFPTYILGMQEWDDTPLYIWDEWVAYTNGGDTGVNQVQLGLWHSDWQDGVAGQLEFTVYALATAKAIEELDPDYGSAHPELLAFLAWQIHRAMGVYLTGSVMPEFKWDEQDRYLANLRGSDDAAPLRAFAQEKFGEDWTRAVLGF